MGGDRSSAGVLLCLDIGDGGFGSGWGCRSTLCGSDSLLRLGSVSLCSSSHFRCVGGAAVSAHFNMTVFIFLLDASSRKVMSLSVSD